jgi:transcription antitermination factor NusG
MNTDNTTCWFVMTHLEMKYFMEWLKTENAQRLRNGETVVEPFYPYDFLKETEKSISNDFAHIVFLKTTESDIRNLVNNQSHLVYRLRLKHYLDTNGAKAIVADKTMQEFLHACIKYRGCFEIIPPISSIEVTDKVRINSGPFAGHEAMVERVRLSHGSIQLDLAVELLSGVMNIRMCDVDKDKVTILNRDSADAIRTDFIEYTQNHLLNILKHRIDREQDPDINRNDVDMLTRLYRYRDHEVKNEAARNHFLALMLICAHLCRYMDDEKQLREKVLESLTEINQRSESKAATDTRVYLWIALYISTQNPVYRDAAKQYVRYYQPKSAKLRSFVSLIRKGRKI